MLHQGTDVLQKASQLLGIDSEAIFSPWDQNETGAFFVVQERVFFPPISLIKLRFQTLGSTYRYIYHGIPWPIKLETASPADSQPGAAESDSGATAESWS